jgi:dihydrofolate reductase
MPRKLVVSEFVSIDGVMEAPGGEPGYAHSGWVFPYSDTPEFGKFKLDEILEAESLLLGRVTYESFAGAWPERTDDVGFADKINAMPKHVVSKTLPSLEWNNSSLLEGDVVSAVSGLKQGEGGPILVNGSIQLVHTLYSQDLVDEYRLMVFPVVLGSGRRMFPDDAANNLPLKLVELKGFENGVSWQVYQRA